MNNLDFTLLEVPNIIGENRFSIFDKYGTKAAITDFAILLGGYVSSNYYTKSLGQSNDRSGLYFTKSFDETIYSKAVNEYGNIVYDIVTCRNLGVRPVISYDSISNYSFNEKVNHLGIKEVEFGEYPQTIVNEEISNELEELHSDGKLNQTCKNYITDSSNEICDFPFEARKHIEYEYNGKKYIRILGDFNSERGELSDGRIVEECKPYWVKVEPIIWLIDENRNIAVSKNLLFAGIKLCDERNNIKDFESTRMKWYLDTYFSKDIVPSIIANKAKQVGKEYIMKLFK